MTTTALYEIETSEGDDGAMYPAEQLWTPSSEDAADNGFLAHYGLYVSGIDNPGGRPVRRNSPSRRPAPTPSTLATSPASRARSPQPCKLHGI